MNLSRNKVIIVSFILMIIVILVLILVYILSLRRNSETLSGQDNSIVSKPIETQPVSIPSEQLAHSEQINLQRPGISPNQPYLNESIVLNFKTTEDLTFREINPSSKLVSGNNFSILFTAVGEGNPVKNNLLPEYSKVNNNLNETIYRVDGSDDTNIQSYFTNQGITSNYRLYYTSTFDITCSNQLPDGSCGTNYIFLKQKDNGDKINLRSYCLINNSSDAKKCDKIIESLNFEIK